MVDTTAPYYGDDELLAKFIKDLEAGVDIQDLIEEYSRRSPQMESELRGIAEIRLTLDQCRPQVARPAVPDRLGEFEIVRQIDHGGMGEIYEARQRRLNRSVALKVIRPGWSSAEAKLRFIREQRILAALHHTNILPIHAAGNDGETHYFTMPYIHGVPMSRIMRNLRQSTRNGDWRGSSPLPQLASQLLPHNEIERAADEPTEAGPLDSGESAPEDLVAHWRTKREYLVSVATCIATVADAVDAAHEAGILHRDLKPSNIMIQPDGHVWVIDFGLATRLTGSQEPGSAVSRSTSSPVHRASVSVDSRLSMRSTCGESFRSEGIGGGTPNYMAPERWLGEPADPRTDVFSLGAILFEFLTLERAFQGETKDEICEKIVAGKVVHPSEIARHVPGDLAAICVKALERKPDSRYSTAREMAQDLRRWVNHEPVSARPAAVHRWAYLWCRRKPGWASALLVLAMLCLGTVYVAYAEAAELRRKQSRDELVGEIANLLNGTREAGWFEKIEGKCRILLELDAEPSVVRDQLTAAMRGYDARLLHERVIDHGSVYLAFDRAGKRLLASGADDENSRPRSGPSVLELGENKWQESPLKGAGPVAFLPDGTPVTLLVDPADFRHARLHDVLTGAILRDFTLAVDKAPARVNGYNAPRSALSADGSLVAISELAEVGDGIINVWDATTGDRLLEMALESPSKMAFSPDGLLFAVGTMSGAVHVLDMKSGKALREFGMGRAEITMLAFGKNGLRRQGQLGASPPLAEWLLAVGNSPGRIEIRDLFSGEVRSSPTGSHWDVLDAAFCTDGSKLISIAREYATVWDVASGLPLVRIPYGNVMPGVAWSPDNALVAMSAVPAHSKHQGVRVWKLLNGHGSAELHGLAGSVTKVAVSRDEKLIAALTHDFHIGVWDLDAHRLLHVFAAPGREFADNAAIALNKDGSILACATERTGILWDTKAGREIRRWELAPALVNEMDFFDDSKQLVLFRAEVKDRSRMPDSRVTPDTFPVVGRVYNLLADPRSPILEIEEFPARVGGASISGTSGKLVVNGRKMPGGPVAALLFDVQEVGKPPQRFADDLLGALIADGSILMLTHPTFDPTCEIRESRTGVLLNTSMQGTEDIDRKHGYRILQPTGDHGDLYELASDAAARSIARIPHGKGGSKWKFLYRGKNPRFLAPMQSGQLVIVDIEEFRKRLSSLDLGW